MSRIVVKFCGITRESDAREAARLGVDAVGLNFWAESPRFLDPSAACRIVRILPPFIARVGVFVNGDPDSIRAVVRQVGLTAVQLHGDEAPEVCAELEPLAVYKAFRIGPGFRPETMERYPCDTFLLDGWSAAAPGGTGAVVDWDRARALSKFGRIILAGGLTPENVATAIARARPWGVDVASGIERSPGAKDVGRMEAFVRAVRTAEGNRD